MSDRIASVVLLLAALLHGGCDSDPAPEPEPQPRSPMAGFEDAAQVGQLYATRDTQSPEQTRALVERGRALVAEYRGGQRCMNCHAIEGSTANAGPDLKGLRARYEGALGKLQGRVWVHNKIWDSDRFKGLNSNRYPSGQMPRGGNYYTPDEIHAMVEYLMAE